MKIVLAGGATAAAKYVGSQGSSVIKVFSMTAAVTGINEVSAKKAGLDADKVIIQSAIACGMDQ